MSVIVIWWWGQLHIHSRTHPHHLQHQSQTDALSHHDIMNVHTKHVLEIQKATQPPL